MRANYNNNNNNYNSLNDVIFKITKYLDAAIK